MLKSTTLSLVSGGVLAAGLAYLYARRAQQRRLHERSEPAWLDAGPDGQRLPDAADELLGFDDVIVEFVDIDALPDDDEEYDATSPGNLGALWLSRATQTSGVPASRDASLDDEADDFDPAGRPTEPPGELDSAEPRSKDGA